MEGFVRRIGLLVEGPPGGFSLFILVDSSEVDVRMGCLERLNLAVKSVLVKLVSQFTELLFSVREVLVVLDEGLGVAAELLQTLTTRELAVHVTFEVAKLLTGFPNLLDFINSPGTVASLGHEVLHVHRGVV